MKILVIGAGAWGTALAMNAAARHTVQLWARDAAQSTQMQTVRENTRYLPDIPFPPALQVVSGDVQLLVAQADLVVLGTPMAALRSGLAQLRDCQAPVAWLSKGFEAVADGAPAGSHGLLGNEVCAQVAPALHAGVLSGPSFAQEVARHQPTALVAASQYADVRDAPVPAVEPAPPAEMPAGAASAEQTVPAPQAAASGAESAAPAGSELVTFVATAETWLTVRDAQGKQLFNRTLASGETVKLGGEVPLAVTVGRKDAVTVTVRGAPFDIKSLSKTSVARFEVK